jgi:hypothetical protein
MSLEKALGIPRQNKEGAYEQDWCLYNADKSRKISYDKFKKLKKGG